jgi:hypothetical protein
MTRTSSRFGESWSSLVEAGPQGAHAQSLSASDIRVSSGEESQKRNNVIVCKISQLLPEPAISRRNSFIQP